MRKTEVIPADSEAEDVEDVGIVGESGEIVRAGSLSEMEGVESGGNVRENGETESAVNRGRFSCRDAVAEFLPHAWKAATALGTSALALFGAATALAEVDNTIWNICLVIVVWMFGPPQLHCVPVRTSAQSYGAGGSRGKLHPTMPPLGKVRRRSLLVM